MSLLKIINTTWVLAYNFYWTCTLQMTILTQHKTCGIFRCHERTWQKTECYKGDVVWHSSSQAFANTFNSTWNYYDDATTISKQIEWHNATSIKFYRTGLHLEYFWNKIFVIKNSIRCSKEKILVTQNKYEICII